MSSSKSTLTSTPRDILLLIIGNLAKRDKKSLRRTCKALSEAVIPSLFDTVYVAPNAGTMEIAMAICGRFNLSVRSMVVCTSFYSQESIGGVESFCDDFLQTYLNYHEIDQTVQFMDQDERERYDTQFRPIWQLFHTLGQESENYLARDMFTRQLRQILRILTGLDSIFVTKDINLFLRDKCYCEQAVQLAAIRRKNPISKVAAAKALECLGMGHTCIQTENGLMDLDGIWSILIESLAFTSSKIEEISVGLELDESLKADSPYGINMAALLPRPEILRAGCQSLRGLTSLTINFDGDAHFDLLVQRAVDVSPFIAGCTNLRFLQLSLPETNRDAVWYQGHDQGRYLNSLHAVIGSCVLPKLETLLLCSLDGTQKDLMDFLQRSPCLKNLTLKCFFLFSGSWTVLAEKLRGLNLQSIRIEYYKGEDLEWFVYFMDHDIEQKLSEWSSALDKFFFGTAPNPFTIEKFIKWQRRSETGA